MLRIRPLSVADCPAVEALGAEAALELQPRRQLERPEARSWVAVDPARPDPVGYLSAWWLGPECELVDLVTLWAWRRRGVAQKLIDRLLAEARRDGARAIFLEVRVSNAAAVGLYRKVGFQDCGLRRGYYKDGEDALQMVYPLRADSIPGKE